jgi:hypothetical protein
MGKLSGFFGSLTVAGKAIFNPMTDAGDMIIGGVAGLWDKLTAGAELSYLQIVGCLPTWVQVILCTALGENTTVTLTTAMTAADKQALIDATPHNLNGYNLIFQFADSTHTHDDLLNFDGFWGGGSMYIQGNAGESETLHTNQAVYIDATGMGANDQAIYVTRCSTLVCVRFLKIQIPDLANVSGIWANTNGSATVVSGNYVYGAAKTNGNYGIRFSTCEGSAIANYVSNVTYGITSGTAVAYSDGNDDTGTLPDYSLYANGGGVLGTNGTQPEATKSVWLQRSPSRPRIRLPRNRG